MADSAERNTGRAYRLANLPGRGYESLPVDDSVIEKILGDPAAREAMGLSGDRRQDEERLRQILIRPAGFRCDCGVGPGDHAEVGR